MRWVRDAHRSVACWAGSSSAEVAASALFAETAGGCASWRGATGPERVRRLIAIAAAAAVAVAVVALPTGKGDDRLEAQAAPVLDCRDRVESEPIRPRASRDTVVGPIAFYRLAARFDPRSERGPGGLKAPPMKALAIVQAGREVTVTVPEDQRSWMRLFYDGSAYGGAAGSHSVTFKSCPRASTTQFAGEIYIDYSAAPREGACARIAVEEEGRARKVVTRLFTRSGTRDRC
jgi:hypothetical protein